MLKLPLLMIQIAAVDAQLFRQRRFAGPVQLHPLHRHLPERQRIFADSSLRHLQFLSLPSVAKNSVSFCGVSPPVWEGFFCTTIADG